jgi:hypothetical protein
MLAIFWAEISQKEGKPKLTSVPNEKEKERMTVRHLYDSFLRLSGPTAAALYF